VLPRDSLGGCFLNRLDLVDDESPGVCQAAGAWPVYLATGAPGLALLSPAPIFSIITKPSNDPFGVMAGVAVMIAVSAMACQCIMHAYIEVCRQGS
jgi:hypothetical protein